MRYYLYTGFWYWAMSPAAFRYNDAYVAGVDLGGTSSYFYVGDTGAVRPVISLKSNAISGGTGTMTDPFVVS